MATLSPQLQPPKQPTFEEEVEGSVADIQAMTLNVETTPAQQLADLDWAGSYPCHAVLTIQLKPNPDQDAHAAPPPIKVAALLPLGYALVSDADKENSKTCLRFAEGDQPVIHETLHTCLMSFPHYRALFARELVRKLQIVADSRQVSSEDEADPVAAVGLLPVAEDGDQA